jgi:hypothetical protein
MRHLVGFMSGMLLFYICSFATLTVALRLEPIDPLTLATRNARWRVLTPIEPRPLGDITCDGSVMAEMAEICRCDGVMDWIACFRNSQLESIFCRFGRAA